MNFFKFKKIFMSFLIVFGASSLKSIVPETIATVTLLKCGGLVGLAAISGRYLASGMKKITTRLQLDFNKYPDFECVHDSILKSEQKSTNQQVIYSQPSFLQQIKNRIFTSKPEENFNKNFTQESTYATDGSKNYNWNQTNIHAQQARGLFSRVNNYHYYSDKGDFWKGVAIGSFVVGTTNMYLVLKIKKD